MKKISKKNSDFIYINLTDLVLTDKHIIIYFYLLFVNFQKKGRCKTTENHQKQDNSSIF